MESEGGHYILSLGQAAGKGLKPKQKIQSLQLQDFSAYLATKVSYRDAVDIMKRSWHQSEEENIKKSTFDERIESAGSILSEAIYSKSETILADYGVDTSGIINTETAVPEAAKNPSLPSAKGEKEVRTQIREHNRGRTADTKVRYGSRTTDIEDSAERCCYVSIDDVLVKSQKSSRKKGSTREQKFVSNTVVHIQYDGHSYVLTSLGLDKAMKCTVAFLLFNHLLEDSRLIFFSDGATSIRDAIQKYFAFRQYSLILDWFHLENKCEQYLSMGVKGSKEKRKAIKKELSDILWAGNVQKAKAYISSIPKKNVKNAKHLEDLSAYLDRKDPYIACYAIRKEFGLRNSSNLVENANDRVVAVRQKKKGMSWSKTGSSALAALKAASINGELSNWIFKKQIGFKMAV